MLPCIIALALFMFAGKQNSRTALFAGILLLSLLAGLRASDVGIDTTFYYEAFITDFGLRPWQFKDEGFRLLVRITMWITNSPVVVFFLISLATNALIIIRLWEFRDSASFSYMTFLYITLFYIGTMNTIRQYLAVAILFYATRYLEKQHYLLFIIGLVLATSIHTTAIMGIAFLFVYYWINASRNNRVYIGLTAAIVVPFVSYLVGMYEAQHINNYLSDNIDNINLTFIYRVIIFMLATGLMAATDSKKKSLGDNSNNSLATLFTFASIVASSAGMFFDYMNRLGYYFAMFELQFWGMAIRRREWGWLYWLMPTVYALYTFCHELLFNGSGIFPFHLFCY